MKRAILALAVTVGLTLPACKSMHSEEAAEHEQKVRLNELPSEVQRTVQEHLEGGDIKKIVRENENGQERYEVTLRRNGKKEEFRVGLDGKYLGIEDEEHEKHEKK